MFSLGKMRFQPLFLYAAHSNGTNFFFNFQCGGGGFHLFFATTSLEKNLCHQHWSHTDRDQDLVSVIFLSQGGHGPCPTPGGDFLYHFKLLKVLFKTHKPQTLAILRPYDPHIRRKMGGGVP